MPSSTGTRLTLKFNFMQEIRGAGWSESYDLGYADIPTAIAAKANIAAFIVDRLYCLGLGPILVEAVLSAYVQPLHAGDPPVRRATVSIPIPPAPPAGAPYNQTFGKLGESKTADFAPTVYYIRLQTNASSSPVYSRNCWIAGLPDVGDQTDSSNITDGQILPFVQKFLGDLANVNTSPGGANSVSIRSVDRSGANPVKTCTAWNVGALSYTVPAHGFVTNQPIEAIGMVAAPGGSAPRGRYLVGVVIDANTFTLQGGGAPGTPQKTGGFRAAIVVFNGVNLATGMGFTKRDKGRPFGLSVGRRRRPRTSRA